MSILIAFALGVLIGWVSFPTRHVAWRYGPVSWTGVGAMGLLEVGPLKLAKIGRQWRRVSSVNRELEDQLIVDDLEQPERPGDRERVRRWFVDPHCCAAPDLNSNGKCTNCGEQAA